MIKNHERYTNIQEVIAHSFKTHAKCIAFQELDAQGKLVGYSYSDAAKVSYAIAGFLQKSVPPRTVVAICAPNGWAWACAFVGAMFADCVVVPIDIHSGAAEIVHIISGAKPLCLFTVSAYLNLFEGFALDKIILLDEGVKNTGGVRPTVVTLDEIRHDAGNATSIMPSKKDDAAVILYTSGTTSRPVGVVLTHDNIVLDVFAVGARLPVGENDMFLSVITLSHTFELCCGLILPLFFGAGITYSHSIKYTTIFKNMRIARPTIMLCVPHLFRILLEHLVQKGTSRPGISLRAVEEDETIRANAVRAVNELLGGKIRYLVCGGAPLDTSIIAGYRELKVELLQVYGLTETSGVSTITPLQNSKDGSVGLPIDGVKIRIGDGAAAEGEICISGPNLMKGYHNNPRGTQDAIRDGWLFTGDIGYLDRDGFLFITGRSKNVIVTASGVNVYPEELEARIRKSPFVKDVCVIGKQRPDRTETIHAVVVLNKAHYQVFAAARKSETVPHVNSIIREEIDRCTADLARYKKVLDFQVRLRDLPRGRTNKVIRREAKREAFSIDGRLGRPHTPSVEQPIALVNGTIVTPFRVAEKECLIIENGKITQLGRFDSVFLPPGAHVIDATGKIITPGFIDLHTHGCNGHFFNDADEKAVGAIVDFAVSHGTTCMLATLYIDQRRLFVRKIAEIARLVKQKKHWGVLYGIHLEGPFINKSMKGALNEQYIWDATVDNWLALKKAGKGEIKQMTIAPEVEGLRDIMQLAVQDGVVLAVAHSEARYEDVEVAVDNGLSQVTHIFNAMHPMHHREPGVVAAALLKRELKVHLIADGTHVHPAVIDMLYRLKGASGIVLISDSISATGKEDGRYEMAGKEIIVKNGKAYLTDGTLAGSTVTLEKAVATMVRKAGISLDEAVRMASLNPARVLGIDHRKGVLAAGKDADMVVMNENFDVEMTIIGGTIVYNKNKEKAGR